MTALQVRESWQYSPYKQADLNVLSGEALVEFENDEMTTKAMSKHKGMMGTRYIELFRVSRADLANASSAPVAPIGGPVAKRERNVPGPNMNKGSGVSIEISYAGLL